MKIRLARYESHENKSFKSVKSQLLLEGLALISLVKMVLSGGVDHCYSDIGCFPLSAEFYHPQHRPINVRPWHRSHIKTQFELFNRRHPEGHMLVPWDKFNLLHSNFDPKLETKIIIPGWLDNINRAVWVRKLKDSLLWLWAPVNIIVVRWRNFTPYTIATANTRVVGAELANLLKSIESELNYDRAYYHIIGHSLGAHIAGYCGDRVYGLGRITALDPARPFFQGMPKSVRLDRGDAKFVDAIHSDFTPENAIFLLMSYGMTTPVGHLDFYPNGPPLFQPGCLRDTLNAVQNGIARGLEHNSLSVAFLEALRYLTACDHQRSHEWFIESITNRECAFVGVRCNEFEGMINGRCTCDDSPSACAIMGIHADQMYMNNVHEELWPVRAGSIEYKYKSARGPRPPRPPTPPEPPLEPAHTPSFDSALWSDKFEFANPELGMAGTGSPPAQDQMFVPMFEFEDQALELATKEEVRARLKHQASRLQQSGEPQIADSDYESEPQSESSEGAVEHALPTIETSDDTVSEPAEPAGATLEQQIAALEDMAFVQYLRINLLTQQLSSLQSSSPEPTVERRHGRDAAVGEKPLEGREASEPKLRKRDGHPGQFDGHPLLVSDLNRDIESWYEDNSKWFLKTNNRSPYCSNQYQLLVFLGPLDTSSGRDSLRANLLVSIVGSRGQLLNQRFVPRGSSLNSFTMQPFFILLEGSYSLGQIRSVSLAWEARKDPDPIQATVSFKSNLLESVGAHVPAYQAKQAPWLPETMKYDKTGDFRWPGRRGLGDGASSAKGAISGSLNAGQELSSLSLEPILAAADSLKAGITSHYSRKYNRVDEARPRPLTTPGRRSDTKLAMGVTECRLRGGVLASATPSSTGRLHLTHLCRIAVPITSNNSTRTKRATQPEPNKRIDLDYSLELADVGVKLDYDSANSDNDLTESQQVQSNSTGSERDLEQDEDTNPAESFSDPYFVPIVDLPEPSQRQPKFKIRPEDNPSDEQVTLDLHNVDFSDDPRVEDTIVIKKVIVSPLQAYYGQHGRNARTFCPPSSRQKLRRDKSIKLTPTLMGSCY